MADMIQYADVLQRPGNVKASIQLYNKPDHAKTYSKFRPEPPRQLIDTITTYLGERCPWPFGQAVDVGCGAGQSTFVLAPYFETVRGFDISESQIKEAEHFRKARNIHYGIAPAECLPVGDQSVQLLTAATCFHWFDFSDFFKEANRVLGPEGVLAIYSSHNNCPITDDERKNDQLKWISDKIIFEDLAPYRSPRVHHEFEQYQNIEFPFDDIIRVQDISQTYWGNSADAVGYIQTMSSFQTCREVNSRLADKLLMDYQNRIMDILEVDESSQQTPLEYRKDYFLIMCRKRTEKK